MPYRIEIWRCGEVIGSIKLTAETDERAVEALSDVFWGNKEGANFAHLLWADSTLEVDSVRNDFHLAA